MTCSCAAATSHRKSSFAKWQDIWKPLRVYGRRKGYVSDKNRGITCSREIFAVLAFNWILRSMFQLNADVLFAKSFFSSPENLYLSSEILILSRRILGISPLFFWACLPCAKLNDYLQQRIHSECPFQYPVPLNSGDDNENRTNSESLEGMLSGMGFSSVISLTYEGGLIFGRPGSLRALHACSWPLFPCFSWLWSPNSSSF